MDHGSIHQKCAVPGAGEAGSLTCASSRSPRVFTSGARDLARDSANVDFKLSHYQGSPVLDNPLDGAYKVGGEGNHVVFQNIILTPVGNRTL
jgi:hypothetical protein